MDRPLTHQYIDRESCQVRTEQFFGDRSVQFLYSKVRERTNLLFNTLISPRLSGLLARFIYDDPIGSRMTGTRKLLNGLNIDLSECLDDPSTFTSPRKLFERKIRYWETRLMIAHSHALVSPADSRVLVGSFSRTSHLFLKEKFFSFGELLGADKHVWPQYFAGGDFAVFRLTPEKYHYNHTPVAGRVLDFYALGGSFHSCHPQAIIAMATPFSKNKRVVTIIDTDVEGGTQAGLVAMVEVVALLIGEIVQCYSDEAYEHPQVLAPGLFLKRGQPKSLYRPGSSTDVLIFQKGRVDFCEDLVRNMVHPSAQSIFSQGFGRSLVETEVKVRSPIGFARRGSGDGEAENGQ